MRRYGGQKINRFKKYSVSLGLTVPAADSIGFCDAAVFNGWALRRNNWFAILSPLASLLPVLRTGHLAR